MYRMYSNSVYWRFFKSQLSLITCDTTYRTSLRDNNCGLRIAYEQARVALAARREKEGELATTFLEFEYLHRKSRCQRVTGGDDISSDVITLGTWFSMFVYIRALSTSR